MDLSGQLMLAPMAGITDAAFRSICVDHGADITVTELVSAESILRNSKKAAPLLRRAENESFFGIQLFGSDPVRMALAAKKVASDCDFIDINMGCPAPKVYRSGAGSELLKYPERAASIVSAIVKAVSIPVSVKIRTGITDSSKALPIAKACERAGASWITVHGRMRKQGYSGTADWETIRRVKNELSIPVIGNGDIFKPEHAKNAIDKYGVDSIAIGRGASGNPWLFSMIERFLDTGSYSGPSVADRICVFSDYLDRAKRYDVSFLNQKLQAQHFIKGLHGASALRVKISSCHSSEQLFTLISSLEQKHS
ncbi:MAG: tRNA dihydrouridine synthase DusB [Nanobdellota archaeon]